MGIGIKENEIYLRQKQSIYSNNRLEKWIVGFSWENISTAIINEMDKNEGGFFPRDNKRSVM